MPILSLGAMFSLPILPLPFSFHFIPPKNKFDKQQSLISLIKPNKKHQEDTVDIFWDTNPIS